MRKQYVNPFIQSPLSKALRDYKIWFHLLDEGEPVEDGLSSIYAMTRTLHAAKPQKVLSDAVRLMGEIHRRGTWRKADLPAILEALHIVGRDYPRLPKQVAHRALKQVFGATT